MAVLLKLRDAVINGNDATATELTLQALWEGTDPSRILDEALILAMTEVVGVLPGRTFSCRKCWSLREP